MSSQTAAIIGTGVIGRSWAIVFARAGWRCRLYDANSQSAQASFEWIGSTLERMGYQTDARMDVLSRIKVSQTLDEALAGVDYVQESSPEILAVKRDLFANLDRLTPANVPIASSTSALMPREFTENLEGRSRALVVHPVNPPHLVPLVEIVGAPWTSEDTMKRVTATMNSVRQSPIRVKAEIAGFILNRLQAAVINEGMALVGEGFVDPDGVDKCLTDGLALRWAFVGPFETMDLNADGGFAEYAAKFKGMYEKLGGELGVAKPWPLSGMDAVIRERRSKLPIAEVGQRQRWRDARIEALHGLKRKLAVEDEQKKGEKPVTS